MPQVTAKWSALPHLGGNLATRNAPKVLILTRRRGEQILIGDDIVITLLGLGSHGEHRVGIDAPRDIPVVRSEIAWKFDEDGNRVDDNV